MKACIDSDGCISCGLCVSICPEVFRFGDEPYAEVYVDVVPTENEAAAKDAEESCPASVITLE